VALAGHTILVVEDEPLIALGIVEDFKAAGASVHTAYNLCDGLRLADHPDLSAAVVDFGLSDGKGSALCERLNERQVPFILHTRGRSNSPNPVLRPPISRPQQGAQNTRRSATGPRDILRLRHRSPSHLTLTSKTYWPPARGISRTAM
jgi:CheY-like chemotaxis protein